MTLKTLGRYEIVGELGKGAMGVVYLARDPLIGRSLALKTFRLSYGASGAELEQFRARFLREAQSAGILNHPNIVTIHDVVVEEGDRGVVFIAMEYVEGTDLKQLLKRRERLPLAFVVDVGIQLANGIEYAHKHGVVHRDIKPANIILTSGGQAKITDFGIARIDASNLTVEGQLLGTPNYMAPEQIQGHEVDHRADLFSLGVLLYEMVTGIKPFAGENLTMVTHRIVHEPFSPPKESIASLPPGMMAVLDKALRKDPDERYQRGRELAVDLEQLRTDRRPAAPSSVSFLGSSVEAAPGAPGAAVPAAGSHEVGGESISTAAPAQVADGVEPSEPRDSATPVSSDTNATTAIDGGLAGLSTAPTDGVTPDVRPVPVPSGTLVAPPTGGLGRAPSSSAIEDSPKRDRRLLWVAAAVGLLLLAGVGFWLTRGDSGRGAAVQEEAWRSDYAAAQRYLEAGDTRAAVVAFDRVLAIHGALPELLSARDQALERLAAEAAQAVADPRVPDPAAADDGTVSGSTDGEGSEAGSVPAEDPKAVVAGLLEQARSALRDRRYERVLDLAYQVNEIEARNRDARRLATAAEDGLARRARAGYRFDGGANGAGRATPRTTPPATPRVAPPPPSRRTTPRPPPPSARTTPTPPPPAPRPPSAAVGVTIAIDLESQIAEGILTIYQGQERVYRDRFLFEGSGMFGRGQAGGKRQDSAKVPSGSQPLKVYLWRKGAATQSVELEGGPGTPGHRTLAVSVDVAGKLRVSWR